MPTKIARYMKEIMTEDYGKNKTVLGLQIEGRPTRKKNT